MKTSQASINKIADFEGIRLKAYKCPAGVWTIGVGHTGGVTEGMTITREQAMNFFAEDIKASERAVDKLGMDLTQNQFDALVSFAYNCGVGNLQRLCKGRTKRQIADAIPAYNKAKDPKTGKMVVLAGLTRRRAWERTMLLSGSGSSKKSVHDLAQEVIDGKWGNGVDRKNRLHAAGYDYATVQKEVNRMLRGK